MILSLLSFPSPPSALCTVFGECGLPYPVISPCSSQGGGGIRQPVAHPGWSGPGCWSGPRRFWVSRWRRSAQTTQRIRPTLPPPIHPPGASHLTATPTPKAHTTHNTQHNGTRRAAAHTAHGAAHTSCCFLMLTNMPFCMACKEEGGAPTSPQSLRRPPQARARPWAGVRVCAMGGTSGKAVVSVPPPSAAIPLGFQMGIQAALVGGRNTGNPPDRPWAGTSLKFGPKIGEEMETAPHRTAPHRTARQCPCCQKHTGSVGHWGMAQPRGRRAHGGIHRVQARAETTTEPPAPTQLDREKKRCRLPNATAKPLSGDAATSKSRPLADHYPATFGPSR